MLLFWILASLLTVGVVFTLARPLLAERPTGGQDTTENSDIAIYRDQLTEVDSDRARGLISGAEAEAARAEVARRLLARAGERSSQGNSDSTSVAESPGRIASQSSATRAFGADSLFVGAGLLVPAIALAIYLALGSPWLPGRPISERLAAGPSPDSKIEDLVSRVEARLRANPAEGQGWDVIAPVYLRLERYRDAADAYKRALELLGETARRLSGFAESTVLVNDGIVTEPARKAYLRLLELQPGRPDAQLGLAMAKEQDGRIAEATSDYRSILAKAPPDAPWRAFVQARLVAIAAKGAGSAAEGSPRALNDMQGVDPDKAGKGPDVAAVVGLPPAERAAMIRSMVERLEGRLKADGGKVAEWQKLVRAWTVLGERTKAEAALADARKALARDATGLAAINAFAKTLGFKS